MRVINKTKFNLSSSSSSSNGAVETHISGFQPGQATPVVTNYSVDGPPVETGTATFTMQMVFPK